MSFKLRLLWKLDFIHINMFHIHIKFLFRSSDECIQQMDDYIKAGVEHFLIEVYGVGKYFQALELFTDTVFSYFKENI